MAGEKIMENSEPGTQALKSDFLTKPSKKDMASRKEVIASDSTSPVSSLGDASSGINAVNDQAAVADQGAYYPPTSCYNYYYPGYNGAFPQLDDQGYLSGGVQSDNSSLLYYLPGYGTYTTGFMTADGELPYGSSGYLQQPVSYGSELLPAQPWDPKSLGDATDKVVTKCENVKSVHGRNGSMKSNGFNSSQTINTSLSKTSNTILNSKARQFTVSSNFSKSFPGTQPLKPLSKPGYNFQSTENMNGFYPAGKFSAFNNPNQGVFSHYGSTNYQSNGRVWNGNQKFKSRYYRREGDIEASMELTRGPRTSRSGPSELSAEDGQPEQTLHMDKYNFEDFQSEYENAKFFVIKSYSEDDVHKCIKYDVWSSTPNGNKKLDAAFRDAEVKAAEQGTKYPVFLFFSVNASGQFVGVAEMIGQVDFNKNMDFWQLDKWNGFFPVKWHIVKDLPNNRLNHIILENNDNRAVTYSRDTQQIGLKQGLEMLNIFKSYSAKTSLLDDFNFYENREKSLKAIRGCKAASRTDSFKNDDNAKHFKGGERKIEEESTITGPSLVSLTNNLSLNSQSVKSSI